ncbi:MAG: NnrU family protein [Gammaproteobacteria bacterium]
MALFVVGLTLFFAAHSVSIVAGPWRDRMVARLGATRWQGLYSLVAAAGFVLIVQGYGAARESAAIVYQPPSWAHHITFLFMLPVFPLLIAAYLPGRIRALTRHPMLLAVIFWSAGHLAANGTVADVLLFGVFLVWAVADRISMACRTPRAIPGLPPGVLNDVIAVVAGLVVYLAFVFRVHVWLFGVSPLAAMG